MPAGPSATPRIAVAIVAPSLAILGGQAVQAHRLLQAWADDPDIEAWLVPINPQLPRWLRPLGRREVPPDDLITQLMYWPLLVRGAPAAPTSRTSFPRPTRRSCSPRCRRCSLRARSAAGDPELSERRGAGSSAALGDRARTLRRRCEQTSCRRRSCAASSPNFGIDADVDSEHHRSRPVSVPAA